MIKSIATVIMGFALISSANANTILSCNTEESTFWSGTKERYETKSTKEVVIYDNGSIQYGGWFWDKTNAIISVNPTEYAAININVDNIIRLGRIEGDLFFSQTTKHPNGNKTTITHYGKCRLTKVKF